MNNDRIIALAHAMDAFAYTGSGIRSKYEATLAWTADSSKEQAAADRTKILSPGASPFVTAMDVFEEVLRNYGYEVVKIEGEPK
jgi:hypothetical protein